MPRHPRIVLAGHPHPIVQHGPARHPVFAAQSDYLFYLDNLCEQALNLNVAVLSYCLMTNHVHLLVSPKVVATSLISCAC